jgi:hypothetical protein
VVGGEGEVSGRETEVGERVFVEVFGEILEARMGQEGKGR